MTTDWHNKVWQRTLIEDGRKHDEAMTPGPLYARSQLVSRRPDNTGMGGTLHTNHVANFRERDDAAAFAWLRTNLRALLDGYSQALEENERLRPQVADLESELAKEAAAARQLAEEHERQGMDLVFHRGGHRHALEENERLRAEANKPRDCPVCGCCETPEPTKMEP